jgi:hypothetical protein
MYSDTKKFTQDALCIAFLACLLTGLGTAAMAQADQQKPKPDSPVGRASKLPPEEGCQKLFQKYVIPLQELWKKRPPELKAENTDGYSMIEDLTSEHCRDADTRSDLIALLSKILNSHTGKIAVILPLSKYPHLRIVTNAFESHANAQAKDPKRIFINFDTQEKPEKLLQAIASAVFEHRVTAIVGGSEPQEADSLAGWAGKLMIPTFLLSEPRIPGKNSFVFFAHPTQKSLAKTAVDANIRFGHKKISILMPSDQRSSKFVAAYNEAAKASGITVVHQVSYDSKRFDTMEAAAKKIFRLDGADRREELQKLYETAKQHAKETGTKFNPKMIALQPDIQQDAVLIPDSFRLARHFAKIFVFLGVRKIPMFGHFEWRSVGLVNPWDPFLSNAYFVDFQGLYSDMPERIRIQGPELPFFASNDMIEQADFSMLGWRAISVPLMLAQNKSEPRRKLDRLVPRKTNASAENVYDQENTLVWNAHLFKLSGSGRVGTISLVPP